MVVVWKPKRVGVAKQTEDGPVEVVERTLEAFSVAAVDRAGDMEQEPIEPRKDDTMGIVFLPWIQKPFDHPLQPKVGAGSCDTLPSPRLFPCSRCGPAHQPRHSLYVHLDLNHVSCPL